MGLLDDLELLKKRKPNLLANVQQLQRPAEPYLRQQYPEVYGGLGGLLGMAPDEMAGSILDPNTARVRAGAQIGFPVGTAAQVLPALGQLAPAVKAGARALGPTAVSMGEDYLKRRGLMPELDVYHGSPYKYDKFDASKIGTGEGAQAYGHGLYTAENPGTAQGYQATLGHKGALDLEYESGQRGIPLSREAKVELMRQSMRDVSPKMAVKNLQNASIDARNLDPDKLAALVKDYMESKQGSFYKVNLPDEQIAKMLDYDKHLSEQSPEVQKILLPYQKEIGSSFGTGEQTLKAIAFERRMKGLDDSPAAVSQQLRDMGIPGIKYLDANSRGGGQGTRNFVTFPGEEQSMTILERNGQPMIARPQQQDAAPDLLQYQQMLDEEERKKLGGLLFR